MPPVSVAPPKLLGGRVAYPHLSTAKESAVVVGSGVGASHGDDK